MLRIFSTGQLGTLNISKVQRVFGFQQMRRLMYYNVIKHRHRIFDKLQVHLRNERRTHLCIAKT